MNNLDDNLDLAKIFKRTHKKPRKKLTREQIDHQRLVSLINKIKRGDLDYTNRNSWDRGIYYWGIRKGYIDKDLNILIEGENL